MEPNLLFWRVISDYVNSSGSVTTPSNIIGKPDGYYATLAASTSGSSANILGSFGGLTSGTVSLYGYSTNGYTSNFDVQTSDGVSWSTLYSGTWPANGAHWFTVGSVTNIRYLKVEVLYQGGAAASLNLDAISLNIASFAQTLAGNPNNGTTGSGQVNHPTNILGSNGTTKFAELKAVGNADSAWIEMSLGSHYSGYLAINGYSATGYNSVIKIETSEDGTNWTTLYPSNTLFSGSTQQWMALTTNLEINNVQYVRITASYGATGSDLFISAVYVA